MEPPGDNDVVMAAPEAHGEPGPLVRHPTRDDLHRKLRSALAKKRFDKVPHAVNLLRKNVIVGNADTYRLLADCYDAMARLKDAPDWINKHQRASTRFRGYADSAEVAEVHGSVESDPSAVSDPRCASPALVEPRANDEGTLVGAGDPFVIDRTADRSILHRDDAVSQPTSGTGPLIRAVFTDNVVLLHELIHALPQVLRRPGYREFATLHEMTLRRTSGPYYKTVTVSAEPSSRFHVWCEVRLCISPQLRDLVTDSPVFADAQASTVEQGKQLAATKVIQMLRERAAEVRRAAQASLARGFAQCVKVWMMENLAGRRYDAFRNAKSIIVEALYGSRVRPYGSFGCGIALPNSDIDVEVVLPKPDERMQRVRTFACHSVRVLRFLERRFIGPGTDNVRVIDARVPILRYFDLEQRVAVEISISKSDNSVLLTRLLRKHVSEDPRIWDLVMFVRYWSSRRRINKTVGGYINAVGWTIMAIWFLRTLQPAIGAFFRIENRSSGHMARDVVFRRVPWESTLKNGENTLTSVELIGRFFEFFDTFKFGKYAISLRYQRPVLRTELDENRGYFVLIENPVEPGANVAAAVEHTALLETKKELRRAHHLVINVGDMEHICRESPWGATIV